MPEKKPKTNLHILAAWLHNRGVEVDLREHPLAAELREAKKRLPDLTLGPALISTHQIHATGPCGKISVVRGGCSFGDYEICSLEGGLFDDVYRFGTVKEAGTAIHELLTTGQTAEIADA